MPSIVFRASFLPAYTVEGETRLYHLYPARYALSFRLRETPPASRSRHAYPAPGKRKARAIFFTLERAEIRVDREKAEPAVKERRIPEAWRLENGCN